MSGTESATATVTGVSNGPGVFQYTVSLTNTGTAPIGIFWFAWDDLPDQDFMNAVPSITGAPSGWVALSSTHTYPGGIGYGIEWYTFTDASRLAAGSTTTSFTFTSAITPAQLAAASVFDPTFQTTSSFVYQTASFIAPSTDPGFNFVVAVACFAAGTMILTPDGEYAVEDLRPGDPVVTAAGETRAVRWVGQRRIDCASHETPHEVWPVRIASGALSHGVPARDLYLSPDHALFLSGVLVGGELAYLADDADSRRQPILLCAAFPLAELYVLALDALSLSPRLSRVAGADVERLTALGQARLWEHLE